MDWHCFSTALYPNTVGIIAWSRPTNSYIGPIYQREWWDIPLALTSWQVCSHFPIMPNFGCYIVRYFCLVLCDHCKLWHIIVILCLFRHCENQYKCIKVQIVSAAKQKPHTDLPNFCCEVVHFLSCLSDWTICGFDSDRKSCLNLITWLVFPLSRDQRN